jgi:hypothetical protein
VDPRTVLKDRRLRNATAVASSKYGKVRNFYSGEFQESSAAEALDVVSPIDGNLLSQVPPLDKGRTRRRS